MPEIYAEKIRTNNYGGYYDLRYVVYNGDIIGIYTIFINGDKPYGASRDYHRVATPAEIEAYANRHPDDFVYRVQPCTWHDDKPSICDGSGLVERTTDDKRAFEIAAMMAEVVGSPKA
jgi:hypothetical protein